MIAIDNKRSTPSSRFWWSWCGVIVVACAIHLTTLQTSPPYWLDEIQLVDFGRVSLDPGSDWSITWSITDDRPWYHLSFLGSTLQEVSYRTAGSSSAGPRISGILGAVIAGTVMLGWLLARGAPPVASWLLSLAFFLDPLFVRGYKGARVDAWAMACCLGACWLLRSALSQHGRRHPPRWVVMLAGVLAAAAPFVWPSAVILYPLIILELAYLLRKIKETESWKTVFSYVLSFGAGGLAFTTLLLVPVWQQVVWLLNNLQGDVGRSVALKPFWDALPDSFRVFRTTSPFLPLIALAGAIFRREAGLIAATVVATVIVLVTSPYSHRLVYLLPYLFVLSAGLYQHLATQASVMKRRAGPILLIVLLAWSAGLTLVARPILAWSNDAARSPNVLLAAAETSIGAGPHHVLVDPWEFYYAGRSLGWKIYRPHSYREVDLPKLFERMDYAIIPSEKKETRFVRALEKAGLHYKETLVPGHEHAADEGDVIALIRRIGGAQPYGPYLLYGR